MDRFDRGLLAVFAGFTVTAVLGYATIGRHPAWLGALPGEWSSTYAWTYGFFARGQVWLAGGVLLAWLSRHAGAVWIPAFVAAYAISLLAELSGTGWGLPFGGYAYSELLGTAWFGRVPLLIPLSWFCMALPAWAYGHRLLADSALARVAVGSLALLVWDLALDPAMSHATRFWVWSEAGPYYGMPWLNLAGWYITGVAIMTAFELLGAGRWAKQLRGGWLYAFYALNLLMPLGMCAAAGLWGAVVVTLGALGLLASLGLRAVSHEARDDRLRAAVGMEPVR